MVETLSDDTLEKLAEEGITDDTTENSTDSTKDDLPDITLRDSDTKKDEGDPVSGADESSGETDQASEGDSDLNKTVGKTLAEAGYDDEALTARLTKDGGISDEFIQELKGKIDPEFVDAHVGRLRAELELAKVKESGEYAQAQERMKAVQDMNEHIYQSVGGQDKFKIMGDALKGNMDKTELASLNAKLASGNKDVVDSAMKEAVAKYNNIRGMGGKLMEGDQGQGTDAQEHITKAEYRALMRTEKYKTDPKYARKVDEDRMKTKEADAQKYNHGMYFGFHKDKGRYAL